MIPRQSLTVLAIIVSPGLPGGCDRAQESAPNSNSQERLELDVKQKITADPATEALQRFAEMHGAAIAWLGRTHEYGHHATIDFQEGLRHLDGQPVAFCAWCLDVLETPTGLKGLFFPTDDLYSIQEVNFLLGVDEATGRMLVKDMHDDTFTEYRLAARLDDILVSYARDHRVIGDAEGGVDFAEVEHAGFSTDRLLLGAVVGIEAVEAPAPKGYREQQSER